MKRELTLRIYTALISGLIVGIIFFLLPSFYFTFLLTAILIWILYKELPNFYNFSTLRAYFYALLYPLLPFFLLIYMSSIPYYRSTLLLLFLLAFANDIGAYCMGRLYGAHKIWPKISPKKSWEGFIGGWVSVMAVLISWYMIHSFPIKIWFILFFGLLISSVATIGDFFESWLKRSAQIKDAGNILPGHGGLLDRFDSILSLTILFFYILIF